MMTRRTFLVAAALTLPSASVRATAGYAPALPRTRPQFVRYVRYGACSEQRLADIEHRLCARLRATPVSRHLLGSARDGYVCTLRLVQPGAPAFRAEIVLAPDGALETGLLIRDQQGLHRVPHPFSE